MDLRYLIQDYPGLLLLALGIVFFGNCNQVIAVNPPNRVQFLSSQALKITEALNKNDLAEINRQLDPRVKSKLPASQLVAVWRRVLRSNGAVKQRFNPRIESMGSYKLVYVPIKFEKSFLDLKMTYSVSGKLSGFFIVKHKQGYSDPSYTKTSDYKEKSVRFGLAKWKLWGKICIPNSGKSVYPAVVLVHGSGPQDMDESIGSNKPFLDLAHGLASKGIATFRYTKRTKEYKLEKDDIQSLTVKDETIDDAICAVGFLRKQMNIDKNKVFVLGHSLGGMLIPRIEQADPTITGFVCLAGANIPLEDKVVEQVEYLASLGDKGAKSKIKEMKSQAVFIKEVASGKRDIGTKLIMGASQAYWKDLAKYKPLDGLKKMKKPVLFLQGGRDYQVTESGDFARWKEAAKQSGAGDQFEFKLYPNLNHLFMAGVGKSKPQEYLNESRNVESIVISDIATWIANH